ncbi:Uncharacterized protein conserved in bacteria (DUF2344) [Butyrivibrio fibrisolvens 16/4]|nr:Uncharacterized protein conserved in bacteria (DUF2344) [Butyrivibrio fibrisolvens 16/4]
MRVRIRFEKTGIMRYVGHLDLMRFSKRPLSVLSFLSDIQKDLILIR